ncbi:MAG: hypothetical protein JWL72_2320 [Ilumatobacteraceae bacterium]|nr:hypothetical protein [Ilumatobacteraceae bacterium]
MDDNENQTNPGTPDVLPSTERRVAQHLGTHASSITLVDTPVAEVIQRGKRRRIRRRTTIGVLSVAAVCAAAIVSVQALSEPIEHRKISSTNGGIAATDSTSPGTATVNTGGSSTTSASTIAGDSTAPDNATPPSSLDAGQSALTTVPSDLVWNPVVPDSTEALAGGVVLGVPDSAPYLALSSAPGRSAPGAPFVPTLYRSDDGISWTPTEATADLPFPGSNALDSYDGSLYALGTAAATAPISANGTSDVVLKTSTDGGGSWQQQILPIDLRNLADKGGVGHVSLFTPSVGAGPAGAIAAAQVNVFLDLTQLGVPSEYDFIQQVTPNGIIVARSACLVLTGGYGVATTVAMTNGSVPAASSVPCDATTATTACTLPGGACSAGGTTLPDPSTGSANTRTYTWAELGLDTEVVDALLAPPHLFVEPPGADQFTEVTFPPIPAGVRAATTSTYATSTGFAMTVQGVDVDNRATNPLVYLSADGTNWTESTVSNVDVLDDFGQLDDGSFVVIGSDPQNNPAVSVSADGTNWTTTALDGLLTPADGKTALLGYSGMTIGGAGITVAATITVDPFAEGGPSTIDKDGVTVSMLDQFGSLVFTDDATGAELGRTDRRDGGKPTNTNVTTDPSTGLSQLMNADGTVRLALGGDDLSRLYTLATGGFPQVPVLLHSHDGIHWSREDLESIAGFPVIQVSRLTNVGNRVLVTLLDTSTPNGDGTPRTVVLIGTPQS